MGSRCECRGSDAEAIAELDAGAAKMQTAGIHPVAHSSQDWIDATLMDNIVCGMDIELYRRDARSVGSPMRFAVDMGKACLFDRASQRLI